MLEYYGKNSFRDTPMFPLEVLAVKRSKKKLKKILEKKCLNSLIIMINI